MYADTIEALRRCESCQIHANIPRQPKHDLIPVSSTWPFYKWGIDLVGPFPQAPGGLKYLIVAIDYFTKWVEAKPMAQISGRKTLNFVWEYIVCRFGLPHEIASDNGTQFAGEPFVSWCAQLKIKQVFTSVAHPQGNGQVEVTNREIVKGIKARLGKARNGWVDELASVLWAHRTTPKESTGETPYSLVYGHEAVIPPEVLIPSHRVASFSEEENEEGLRVDKILLEERREKSHLRQAINKEALSRHYNRRVKSLEFMPGDYVFRKNEASLANPPGKLAPNWEGPYIVTRNNGNGSYQLSTMEGDILPRSWNIVNLKRCYV